MRSLYALLGRYECPQRVQPGETPEMGYMTSTKDVNGHLVNTRVDIPGVLDGRGVMGWNPVDRKYFAYYADDWGTTSTATAPGWVDGHLVFTGPHTQVSAPDPSGEAEGVRLTLLNDYKINRPGHYTVVQTLIVPNGQTVQNTYDCTRV
jgi:hypothetical protein